MSKLDLRKIPAAPDLPRLAISCFSALAASTDAPRSEKTTSASTEDKSGSGEVLHRSSKYLKRTKISLVGTLLLLLSIAPVVNAQQITAPTTPNTQNPQPTQSDIIKSESNVQESSDATLLNNTNRRITVEAGTPLPPPVDVEDERSLTRLWLAIFGGLLAALLATALLSRLAKANTKYSQTVESQAEDNAPAVKEEAKAKTSQPAPKSKKHPTSKKKKRRSKKKKS